MNSQKDDLRLAKDDTTLQLFIGGAIVFTLMFVFLGWAATSNLSGAVLAAGTVVVDSNVKKVQHPAGGVVGEIRVRDGDKVDAGDIVMRLDETITRANLGVVVSQLNEISVRQARLKAERDGEDWVWLSSTLAGRDVVADILQLVRDEQRLFESRKAMRDGRKAQLRERVAQLQQEILGLQAQQTSKGKEIALMSVELSETLKLWQKNLVPLSKKTALERDAARLEGEHASLASSIAQARGKITETELQIVQIDQELSAEVTRELREMQAKEAELTERRVAAEDQLKRIDIRAPQAGVVHQLAVHTVGGVINPSEPIMLVVPEGEDLVVEARVAPQDIDSIRIGQTAFLRFTAFNQRTTPEFKGTVIRVAADIAKDPQNNASYFTVRIKLQEAEQQRMSQLRLVPGMPTEVHIKTTDRTALSYLMKPLTDQFARAFVER